MEVPVEDLGELDARSRPEPAEPAPLPTEADPTAGTEVTGGTTPRRSVWPAVEERVLDLVRAHRSTIVFVNSRRLAERLTARLNELAAEQAGTIEVPGRFPAEAIGQSGFVGALPETASVVARAHHGSMSREQRTRVEEELKSGRLPCVVATSSLELGIDMGAVDLVIRWRPHPRWPPGCSGSAARATRWGPCRGGGVPEVPGRSRVVRRGGRADGRRRHRSGAFPRNPLDVLAQHIVAMVAVEPRTVDDVATTVRRAAPFASLPDDALHAVLDMLAGRYPSEEFGELRARITWDRITGVLQGRPGAQRLAVTSGGTIPDRGLFTVMTPGDGERPGSRVGELDEEMVYESRVGDTVLLGTSSWRVTDITHDRVVVVPAPGEPARMPFWRGDTPGRPAELGRAVGGFLRFLSTADKQEALRRMTEAGLDERAGRNLLAYVDEQRAATRHVPSDRTILLERFRDELGDWRVVVHSPFGARVNAPWALAIAARLRKHRDVDAHVVHSDDGIVLRLPDTLDDEGREVLIGAEDVLFDPDEIESLVAAEVGGSALFAARFRMRGAFPAVATP